jgi:hypothetical protein
VFGELLPEKPGWMEQEEFENESATRLGLERLTKEIRRLPCEALDFELADDAHPAAE